MTCRFRSFAVACDSVGMHRLKLRRAVYGAALGAVLYHLLASQVFGADFSWRDVLALTAVWCASAAVGYLILESIRSKPNGQDTDQQ